MGIRFAGLDFMKFLMAFMVIAIHTTDWSIAHLTDAAVPFFFIVSGFLLFRKFSGKKEEDLQTIIAWTWKVFKLYAVWSIVYLPFAVYGFHLDGLGFFHAIKIYLRNFLLVGENYLSWPLWYLLGLVWCGLVIYILRKINVPVWGMFLLGLFLYVAASVFSLDEVDTYKKLFKTTNNGLFLGLLYVTTGAIAAERYGEFVISSYNNSLVFGFFAVAFFVGLQFSDYFLWPFALALFMFCLDWPFSFPSSSLAPKLGLMSKTIYLVHMLFAGLLIIVLGDKLSPVFLFAIVSLLSLITAYFSLPKSIR
ncbi:MAG: acyltransferase family protein [Bacteroidales bacterium]|nr:acyltransferase family protein [Bacteroidales bacterium]